MDTIPNEYSLGKGIPQLQTTVQCAVIAIGYAFLTYFVTYNNQLFFPGCDYNIHMTVVVDAANRGGLLDVFKSQPYPGWHVVAYCIYLLIGKESALIACSVTCSLFSFLTACVTFYICKSIFGATAPWLCCAITVVLLLVSAIYLPWYSEDIYRGKGSINIWHNPTYNAVKPFALLSGALLFKIMKDKKESELEGASPELSPKNWISYSLVSIICLIMKPSFFQVQMPTHIIIALFEIIRYKQIRFSLSLLATLLPCIILACIQFVLLFDPASSTESSSIIIAPFVVMGNNGNNIFISTVLFLAFPLYSIFVLRKQLLANGSPFAFLVIMLTVGLLEWLILAESGSRIYHGNLAWGYYLSVALFWAFVLPLFIRQSYIDKKIPAASACIGTLLIVLHFVSGCIYACQLINGSDWL